MGVQAKYWQTPTNADSLGGHLSRSGDRSDELLLKGQACYWATPNTQDISGFHPLQSNGRTEQDHGANLKPANWATGPQTEPTAANGRVSLNPLFVEWLMGWPRGWTDCGSRVTGWSRWLQQSRSFASELA